MGEGQGEGELCELSPSLELPPAWGGRIVMIYAVNYNLASGV